MMTYFNKKKSPVYQFLAFFKGISLAIVLLLGLMDRAAAQYEEQFILDMVHHNPGEPLTNSSFNDPEFLKANGYDGQVINDFTFVHTAITYDKLNRNIFPEGSAERKWVDSAADKVKENIRKAHKAGIKAYYFTDIIVLPKKLVSIYEDEICDEEGKITFEKPRTLEIHRIMLDEVFEKFPDLDGLVIRTGETYLNNVPHHTGNGPITNGPSSHVKLINLLREEVCNKRDKKIFYRTWSFGGMHEKPDYYLEVTNNIEPHKNLIFSIKHTKGDYQRTFDFNPTLTLGRHPQIVEVQAQREYEGKGAYPNYVMNGVINGFEEYDTNTLQKGYKGLIDIKNHKNFAGVWSWSRGGGWVGPYIQNEFWCRLNAWVISNWGKNTSYTEEEVFDRFMDENGIKGGSRKRFRELCLLSAKAVLRGHSSASLPVETSWTWWMRDEFLGGIDPNTDNKQFSSEGLLHRAFTYYHQNGQLKAAVAEKYEAVKLWEHIVKLSKKTSLKDKADQQYLRTSSKYGLILHSIIAEGWNIMAMGFDGDETGNYNFIAIEKSIEKYDGLWKEYEQFKRDHPQSATLYKPYAFEYIAPAYHAEKGMGASVNKYRNLSAANDEK
jgi:hypothetical protein